jgi:hypothetical protein
MVAAASLDGYVAAAACEAAILEALAAAAGHGAGAAATVRLIPHHETFSTTIHPPYSYTKG